MATFTASAADSITPAHFKVNGVVQRRVQFVGSLLNAGATAEFSVGDVVKMVKIPAFSCVTGVAFSTSMSAGAVSVKCGDSTNASAYASTSVLSGTVAIVAAPAGMNLGKIYGATEDAIQLKVTVLSAAPTSSKINMIVTYYNSNS